MIQLHNCRQVTATWGFFFVFFFFIHLLMFICICLFIHLIFWLSSSTNHPSFIFLFLHYIFLYYCLTFYLQCFVISSCLLTVAQGRQIIPKLHCQWNKINIKQIIPTARKRMRNYRYIICCKMISRTIIS